MRDGTKFTTWKDFAWSVMEELDDLHDCRKKLQGKYDALREEFVIFKTTVMVAAGIIFALALAAFGIFQFAIN